VRSRSPLDASPAERTAEATFEASGASSGARTYAQEEGVGGLTFYAHSAVPPRGLLRAIPGLVARLDPNLPVNQLKTLPQQVKESASLDHLITTLSAGFALLATLLAALGLYGVLAYSVAQRTREIGVRVALGADGARLRNMVLGQVGRMVLAGGAIGLVAALALGRYARSLLYEIEGPQPAVILGALAVLGAVALCASYVPARRASGTDPMVALRYE
jgi:ABC-type antimicrobial peptide transport system permease subunit